MTFAKENMFNYDMANYGLDRWRPQYRRSTGYRGLTSAEAPLISQPAASSPAAFRKTRQAKSSASCFPVRRTRARTRRGRLPTAVIGPRVDSEVRRGRDYVRVVIVMTAAAPDVAASRLCGAR